MCIYIKNPILAYKKIVDSYLLVDIKNEDKVYRLNSLAGEIWEHCDGIMSSVEIARQISDNYDDTDLVTIDILAFFLKMKKEHLLLLKKRI